MEEELERFNDPDISSRDAKVPLFLKLTYILLPIWGLVTFYIFCNGSVGWFDRGYWHELQIAANTTFPIEDQDNPHKSEQADFSPPRHSDIKQNETDNAGK